ncbi:hypothetical protein EVAR_81050_1 [Eumeta japonica]|uniref:Uncharacterized protein n=1 Tax=Eumeta variegata TaxID=151549 RepID=A0A4C1T6E8_EUMVA|nr:hypothetical protein EVAR_81050_1 [Eumeta japonica]
MYLYVDEAKNVRGANKRTNFSKKNNECWNFEVRKIVREKKKTWLGLLYAKANHRVQRKDVLKDKLKDAESTHKNEIMRAKECVNRRKNEIKERYDKRFSDNFWENHKLYGDKDLE